MPNHYSLADTAELCGLSPTTLQKYTQGFSDLVRGEDFYVHRYSLNRRRLYFTPRGLYRLRSRSYSTFRRLHVIPPISFTPAIPWRYNGNNHQELNQRLRNRVILTLSRYKDNPCAVPNCPCVTHKLGLPQADEYARLRELKREARERRK